MKYKLLEAETVFVSRSGSVPRMETMYRIQAVQGIPRYGVKSGQKGGYVSSSGVLSHQGDCWIADNAKVYGNIKVLDNAFVGEEARIVTSDPRLQVIVSGNASVKGNAFISQASLPSGVKTSLITGDANISGYVNLSSPCVVEGRVQISGNVRFGKHCSVLNNARIRDEVTVGENTVIAGDSEVLDNAVIGSDCEILGKSILTTDARIADGQKVINHVYPELDYDDEWLDDEMMEEEDDEAYFQRKASHHQGVTSHRNSVNRNVVPVQSIYAELFTELKEKFDAYHNDVINLIRFPVMSDMTNDFTLAMVTSMRRAERAMRTAEETEIKTAVLEFEERFLAAESNARKIASTAFSPEEKKHTEIASQMFSMAINEASAENEKKTALRRAFKELEGIMDIPETAKSAMIAQAGLLELEA